MFFNKIFIYLYRNPVMKTFKIIPPYYIALAHKRNWIAFIVSVGIFLI